MIWLYSFMAFTFVCALIVWARKLLASKPATQHRGLFRWSDGVKIRESDPIAVLIALEAHKEFRFDLHPIRAQNGEAEAFLVIADAVRQAFGVSEYIEPGKPGLTVRECYELLREFLFYADSQKKSSMPTQTSAESTVAMSTDLEPPTTSGSLDSGSIAPEAAPSLR